MSKLCIRVSIARTFPVIARLVSAHAVSEEAPSDCCRHDSAIQATGAAEIPSSSRVPRRTHALGASKRSTPRRLDASSEPCQSLRLSCPEILLRSRNHPSGFRPPRLPGRTQWTRPRASRGQPGNRHPYVRDLPSRSPTVGEQGRSGATADRQALASPSADSPVAFRASPCRDETDHQRRCDARLVSAFDPSCSQTTLEKALCPTEIEPRIQFDSGRDAGTAPKIRSLANRVRKVELREKVIRFRMRN